VNILSLGEQNELYHSGSLWKLEVLGNFEAKKNWLDFKTFLTINSQKLKSVVNS
jgi:hypothetical protein